MLDYIGGLLRQLCFLGSPPESDLFQVKFPASALATILYASLGGLTWQTLPQSTREFLNQAPLVIICVLWTLDMIVGTILALMKRDYSPRKSLYGLVKLIVYTTVLVVAFLVQHDGHSFDDFLRPVIEMAVILTEMSSVLRNGAAVMQKITGKKSKVLEFFADYVEKVAEEHLNHNHQNGTTHSEKEVEK